MMATVGVLISGSFFGLLYGLFPPLSLAYLFWRALPFLAFLAIPIALGALAATPILIYLTRSGRMATLAGVLASLVFVGVAAITAEYRSRAAMCAALSHHDITEFSRRPFLSSLQIAGRPVQLDLHAGFQSDDITYGWSYATRDWYIVSPHSWADLPENLFTCPVRT